MPELVRYTYPLFGWVQNEQDHSPKSIVLGHGLYGDGAREG